MEWLGEQLVGAILGAIVSWIFTRIVDGPAKSAQGSQSSADFSTDRSSSNRPVYLERPVYVDVSVKPGGSSQEGDIFSTVVGLLTLFYFAHRPLYLTVFNFVVWLGWGFTIVWFIHNRRWSGPPYGWATVGLVIGCLVLLVGGEFAQNPPQRQVPAVDDFLSSGSATGLGYKGFLWVIFHFIGMLLLVLVAKTMLFLGLGTAALAYEGKSWLWLTRLTSRELRNPHWAVTFIIFGGISGVLLVGGWGLDLIPLYFNFINGLNGR